MTYEESQAIKKHLLDVVGDGFIPDQSDDYEGAYDWFGGNADDAYSGGIATGEIILAQNLLAKFFGD